MDFTRVKFWEDVGSFPFERVGDGIIHGLTSELTSWMRISNTKWLLCRWGEGPEMIINQRGSTNLLWEVPLKPLNDGDWPNFKFPHLCEGKGDWRRLNVQFVPECLFFLQISRVNLYRNEQSCDMTIDLLAQIETG